MTKDQGKAIAAFYGLFALWAVTMVTIHVLQYLRILPT